MQTPDPSDAAPSPQPSNLTNHPGVFDTKSQLRKLRAAIALAQARRHRSARTWLMALMTAAQAAIATVILLLGYPLISEREVVWAIVSAVLVLQPGFHLSLAASVTRMLANLIGALTGLVAGLLIPNASVAVVLALVVVILLCELFRLDLGLRSACASVVIVMMTGTGPIWGTSLHRVLAVAIGCVLSMLIQFLTEPLYQKVNRFTRLSTISAPDE